MTNAAKFKTNDNVFERIASRYDVLCDFFSFGIHRLWKQKVSKIIADGSWTTMLDVASGTGDIVLKVMKSKGNSVHNKVIVSDISLSMLALVERKISSYKEYIDFCILDAHGMPEITDNSIDLYSMSLGLKICDRERVFSEALRVLKPGGKIIILEASNIPINWLNKLYIKYMCFTIPFIGWLATKGDTSAYRYLLDGIRSFPSAENLKIDMLEAGFCDVEFERLSFGIVAIHTAYKPRNV